MLIGGIYELYSNNWIWHSVISITKESTNKMLLEKIYHDKMPHDKILTQPNTTRQNATFFSCFPHYLICCTILANNKIKT